MKQTLQYLIDEIDTDIFRSSPRINIDVSTNILVFFIEKLMLDISVFRSFLIYHQLWKITRHDPHLTWKVSGLGHQTKDN